MNEYQNILSCVKRPSRYLGNEINAIRKDISSVETRVALVFPDLYEIGMSHLGLRILYHVLNKRPDIAAERFFVPDIDYETELKKRGLPLASLESHLPLNRFHIIGFSLEYELCFTSVLHILRLGGIPLKNSERDEKAPLIIAGGSSAVNPEPLSGFVDAFVMGDGEEVTGEIVDTFQEWSRNRGTKEGLLLELSKKEGLYIPSFFDVTYQESGEIDRVAPRISGYASVRKRVVKNLDTAEYPTAPVVPFTKIVHDRVNIEVARGCFRSCRFCQASRVHCPYRERRIETVFRLVDESLKKTGHEEIALTSLNVCDYQQLRTVVRHLMRELERKNVAISLPSIMVGVLDDDIIRSIRRVRKTGFTLVPEAGTERLRRVIRKNVTEEKLLGDVEKIVEAGWNSFKLYFMIGLPTETDEDVEEIADLCYRVLGVIKKKKAKVKNINISIASFVPKSHTPFQWFPQEGQERLMEKLRSLRERLKDRRFSLKDHPVPMSFLEAVFARGDRRLGPVLVRALELGCVLDAWGEHFDYEKWMEAFRAEGIDPSFYANRSIGLDAVLPWSHLEIGPDEEHLKREYRESLDVHESFVEEEREEKTPEGKTDGKKPSEIYYSGKEEYPGHSFPMQKVRLQYRKIGSMRFLSHLETMTVFERAFRRAKIPLACSQGFHPRPKLSFGMALPIGLKSHIEYMDVELSSHLEPADLLLRLKREMPMGFPLVSAENVTRKEKSISRLVEKNIYTLLVRITDEEKEGPAYPEMVGSFLSSPHIEIEREKEGRIKRVDIKPSLVSLRMIRQRKDLSRWGLILRVRESDNVRPEEVMTAFLRSGNIRGNILSVTKVGIGLREDIHREKIIS